jgi:hypothetical protein
MRIFVCCEQKKPPTIGSRVEDGERGTVSLAGHVYLRPLPKESMCVISGSILSRKD